MAKSRKPRSTPRRRKQAPQAPAVEPEQADHGGWTPFDQIKLEVSQLKSLARVVERHAECLGAEVLMGDLNGDDLAGLAGLLHARLVALDEAVWEV